MRPTDAEKEQIKLRATYFNNMAVAIFVVGFLTPFVGSAKDVSGAIATSVAVGLVSLVVSIMLHLMATRQLSEIDRNGNG